MKTSIPPLATNMLYHFTVSLVRERRDNQFFARSCHYFICQKSLMLLYVRKTYIS